MYTIENEKFAYNYLINTWSFQYKFLSDKKYNTKIEEIGEINSKDKYDLLNLYILENEEQFLLQKNINFLKQQMKNLH